MTGVVELRHRRGGLAEALWELAGTSGRRSHCSARRAVARAVLEHAARQGLPVSDAAIFEIDAARWFGAAVGACLLEVTLGEESSTRCHSGLRRPG